MSAIDAPVSHTGCNHLTNRTSTAKRRAPGPQRPNIRELAKLCTPFQHPWPCPPVPRLPDVGRYFTNLTRHAAKHYGFMWIEATTAVPTLFLSVLLVDAI